MTAPSGRGFLSLTAPSGLRVMVAADAANLESRLRFGYGAFYDFFLNLWCRSEDEVEAHEAEGCG